MKGNKTQWYIGTPNGVVMCVNARQGEHCEGFFYHSYKKEGTAFTTIEEMVFALERFFDSINFPHPSTNSRSFGEKARPPQKRQELEKVMSDQELLRKHGDLGSFIIRVQHRQNSSWQGRVTWMEEDKTVRFRSILEMIKLIESALDTVEITDDREEDASWNQ